MGNMTSIRFLELLLFLLLQQVYSQEAESVFRAEGSAIEMGYCFGVDYIVVYRSTPEGDQLLGNSSADDSPIVPPVDLQGRIHINKNQHLLGLQISHLTHTDSGIYRRECWQDHALVSQHTQKLSVCDEEVESEEITAREQDGGAELLCNSTSVGLEETSVRWYSEMYPNYKPALFLDSSVSLDPLIELQGAIEVRDRGALLLLDNSVLKNNQQFYCTVIKGQKCLSFQNMYLPDHSESRDMFASQGDSVVLKCPSDGNHQQWLTPQGKMNGNSTENDQMHISFGDKSEDFSLVIPTVSEEHSGEYSCVSSSLEVQYSLVLCPKKESQEKVAFEGGDVFLSCDVGEGDSQRVQWHRLTPSGEDELIHDTKDKAVPVPEDLRGRLTPSENGSLLTISHLEVRDRREYWCVVLAGPQLLEDDDDYADDYPGKHSGEDDYHREDTGEDDYPDEDYWPITHRCIFKQETILGINAKRRPGLGSELPSVAPPSRNITPADPSSVSNVTAYALGAGLVGLLVVGVIVAVIAIKRRAKASAKQREAAAGSGVNKTRDIKLDVDPGCTERLTGNDDCGA